MPPDSVRILASPFVVIVDTREQLGYDFNGLVADTRQGGRPLEVLTVVGTLRQGDYSIVGHAGRIAVERKGGDEGLADLYGTLGQGRHRFERELARLNGLEVAAVVVEAEWSAVLEGYRHSKLNPKTIWRSVIAWRQRFPRVHWDFLPGRRAAEVMTYRILERWWRDRQEDAKE